MNIRTSLTLEDIPRGVSGATHPGPEDFELFAEEYSISPGDTLALEIYELRERLIPYQIETAVSPTGYINVPVVGRVKAAGLTVPQFEEALVKTLGDREILLDPQVTVSPLFLHRATYSIFGIGVSASFNAPLRAGTFPIRRPDLRLLEAINQVGGLNELVTEVYVFRTYVPPDLGEPVTPSTRTLPEPTEDRSGRPALPIQQPADRIDQHKMPVQIGNEQSEVRSAQDELIQAVTDPEDSRQPPDARPEQGELPELLEPDPLDPFIWVGGEFVPNPSYDRSQDREEGFRLQPPTFDTPAPTVNWARIAGESTHRSILITAASLRTGDPEANIYVRPGDVIRIVSGEIGEYYVMGQVNRVGAFRFNAEAITLKSAIAAAGGLAPLAWPDRCTIYRRVGQREQMIQVNLDRIFAGREPDFQILRGDIINVGTHPFAPFLQRIRALTLPNPVANIGYSFTYARNFADIDSFAVQSNPRTRRDLEETQRRQALLP